ncbi:conserved hypothetical protein [Desulfatibacillum aliphaticivorans]|uniref:MaoC domain protein dehydratase n=1 Tax=Desulfatibacillum aliphaticivorans TaxID=218208 RepID=B8FIW1_DESAL|nr:MaoC family dehydratase [Desulfatibacillum aliphaticivorans]ACL04352.1 conserved hypothetical protein [Desulfatibacillum aliphaticivorans]
MVGKVEVVVNEENKKVCRITSHRRTLSETDIVNFVNLVGLHEPPFIDMEFVQQTLPGLHNKRFAPAPLLISLGMGLIATRIMDVINTLAQEENLGAFHGMVGLEAVVKYPAFPGDTLQVEVEAYVDRVTSKGKYLVNLKHVVKNQDGIPVTIFTEKVMFEPKED